MPDREGLRAVHRLCESVSGANWRPTRFEDELTLSRFACCVCHVIPSTTVMLPCSHLLCEQCLTGSVRQDSERVCPLDAEPFSEDECQMLKLPSKTKQNLKAHCWNEDDGCEFVGTIEAVLLHYDRECAFHAFQCPRCGGRVLRADLAAHYVAGCSESVPSAGGATKNRQDGPSVGCDTSAMQHQLSTVQRQVIELPRTPDSQLLQDIRRAVSDVESSCLRGMTGIEANISSMVARQLNAGLEELKALIRDAGSNHLLTMQSEVNELIAQSRDRHESQIQDIVRVLRDSGSELKEDVNNKLEEMTRVLRTRESNVKDDVKTQLETVAPLLRGSESGLRENANTHVQKIVHALKDTGLELKEHVSRVEANLCSTLSDQLQSLRGDLDRLQQKKEFTEKGGVPAAADVVKKDDMPWRTEKKLILRKLEVFAEKLLKTLEFMRQQIHMHDKKPWVSDIDKYWQGNCQMLTKDLAPLWFEVTLSNAEDILKLHEGEFAAVNLGLLRDTLVNVRFSVSLWPWRALCVKVEYVRFGEGSDPLPYNSVTVGIGAWARLEPKSKVMDKCSHCAKKNVAHFIAMFSLLKMEAFTRDDVITDGQLRLAFNLHRNAYQRLGAL